MHKICNRSTILINTKQCLILRILNFLTNSQMILICLKISVANTQNTRFFALFCAWLRYEIMFFFPLSHNWTIEWLFTSKIVSKLVSPLTKHDQAFNMQSCDCDANAHFFFSLKKIMIKYQINYFSLLRMLIVSVDVFGSL